MSGALTKRDWSVASGQWSVDLKSGCQARGGFTLIELLVVISIIGVLAALTVGLGGLAGRKGKEARIQTEMAKLSSAIENYKASMGFYPPDHRDTSQTFTYPAPNQLYYELSGTIFTNNSFMVPGRPEAISAGNVNYWFGSQGFANSARDPKDLKFTESFKASEFDAYQTLSGGVPMYVLSVPANPTPTWGRKNPATGKMVNPWLYVSTNPTNNPDRFDLWTESVIGGKAIRISNWEKDPVPLN
jgi:prepilin-type N-terminal cleavage/methylation domain-containing protein